MTAGVARAIGMGRPATECCRWGPGADRRQAAERPRQEPALAPMPASQSPPKPVDNHHDCFTAVRPDGETAIPPSALQRVKKRIWPACACFAKVKCVPWGGAMMVGSGWLYLSGFAYGSLLCGIAYEVFRSL